MSVNEVKKIKIYINKIAVLIIQLSKICEDNSVAEKSEPDLLLYYFLRGGCV
jgi:hypothetical protein